MIEDFDVLKFDSLRSFILDYLFRTEVHINFRGNSEVLAPHTHTHTHTHTKPPFKLFDGCYRRGCGMVDCLDPVAVFHSVPFRSGVKEEQLFD